MAAHIAAGGTNPRHLAGVGAFNRRISCRLVGATGYPALLLIAMATGVMLAATYLLTRPTPAGQLGPALDETVTRAGPLDETVTWPGH